MGVVVPQALVEWFSAEAVSVGRVRGWLSGLLGGHPCGADLALVATELFTNACQSAERAGAAGAVIGVAVAWSKDAPSIAVRNAQPGGSGPRVCTPGLDAECGRGLAIVAALATTSGAYRDTDGHWWAWATLTAHPAETNEPDTDRPGPGRFAAPADELPRPRDHQEGW